MMRYVHNHHLNNYEWFLRLDDDAYVNTERLTSILRRVDSSKARMTISLITLDHQGVHSSLNLVVFASSDIGLS